MYTTETVPYANESIAAESGHLDYPDHFLSGNY